MIDKPVVPYTPILSLYHEIISLSDAARVEAAKTLNAEGGAGVARAFSESVALLDAGYANDASFRPRPRLPPAPTQPGVAKGVDLAYFMHQQQTLEVDGHPKLAVRWVDYEVSVLSTRNAATFDRPLFGKTRPSPPAGNSLRADLVLANADPTDRTPTLAEVKVGRDKDPFSALVQLLAYIAHLATPGQYARLRTHLRGGEYPLVNPAQFDGYLMFFKFGYKWDKESGAFVASPSTWLDDLLVESDRLGAYLMERKEIRRHIRRLVHLDLTQDEAGRLAAALRWRA